MFGMLKGEGGWNEIGEIEPSCTIVKFPSASFFNFIGLIGSSLATIHFSRRCKGNWDFGPGGGGLC